MGNMSNQRGHRLQEADEYAGEQSWLAYPCIVASGNPQGCMDETRAGGLRCRHWIGGWRQLSATLADALDCKNLVIFLFDDRSGAADLLARTGAKDQNRIRPIWPTPKVGDTSR